MEVHLSNISFDLLCISGASSDPAVNGVTRREFAAPNTQSDGNPLALRRNG